MKFAKLLKDYATPLESHDDGSKDFVSYKRLKKLLKAAAELRQQRENEHISKEKDSEDGKLEEKPQNQEESEGVLKQVNEKDGQTMCEYEQEFVRVLREDVERINTYFMEQEESNVIKLQDLIDRYEKLQPEKSNSSGSCSAGDVERLRSQFVDLHGELVLLLHWSIVNYAGVLKILKKHDKMLGGHAQKQLMSSILHQPFTSTESINQLVNTAENYVQRLASDDSANSVDVNQILEGECEVECESLDPIQNEAEGRQQTIIKRTRAALGMLTQLQSTAHSPSTLIQVETFPAMQQPNDSVLEPKRPRVS